MVTVVSTKRQETFRKLTERFYNFGNLIPSKRKTENEATEIGLTIFGNSRYNGTSEAEPELIPNRYPRSHYSRILSWKSAQ